ncbi:hypothetical protein BH10BAC1_BH10BAC1_15960 [soil metagenome]
MAQNSSLLHNYQLQKLTLGYLMIEVILLAKTKIEFYKNKSAMNYETKDQVYK